jgi:hypothetical protein
MQRLISRNRCSSRQLCAARPFQPARLDADRHPSRCNTEQDVQNEQFTQDDFFEPAGVLMAG